MKKLLFSLMLILAFVSQLKAQWLQVGNTLQRTADGKQYRTNLGSPGFVKWYTQGQIDSLILTAGNYTASHGIKITIKDIVEDTTTSSYPTKSFVGLNYIKNQSSLIQPGVYKINGTGWDMQHVSGFGTSQIINIINGGGSGANSGAATFYQNGGTTIGTIGNYSAIHGGTFNNTFEVTGFNGLYLNTAASTVLHFGSKRIRIDSTLSTATGLNYSLVMDTVSRELMLQKISGSGSGTVTSVTSANSDIGVANTTTTPVLTLNSGSGANQIVKRDGSGNLNATTVTTNANLTGAVTSIGNATLLGSFSSANLATALTDETGSGVTVFSGSPALTGIPTAPTASGGTNTTQIATTAFVTAAVAAAAPTLQTVTTSGNTTTTSIGIGTTSPLSALHVATNSTSTPRGILSDQNTSDALGSRITMRKSRGTQTSPTVITTGDVLGSWTTSGHDGTNYIDAAKILSTSTGTISTGVVPSVMALQTMNTSGTLTTGISINQAQAVTMPSYTLGSIPFFGTGGLLTQHNSKLFYDGTNDWMGIGTTTPRFTLDIISPAADNVIGIRSTSTSGYSAVRFDASTGSTVQDERGAVGYGNSSGIYPSQVFVETTNIIPTANAPDFIIANTTTPDGVTFLHKTRFKIEGTTGNSSFITRATGQPFVTFLEQINGTAQLILSNPNGTSAKQYFGSDFDSMYLRNNVVYTGSGNVIDNNTKTTGEITLTGGTTNSAATILFSLGNVNTIPSEKSRITNNGNWLVNTTTDNATDNIQVNGSIISGVPGTSTGAIKLGGATSGTVTIKSQAAAGTYEFDVPNTAGTAGQVLTSQGGAGAAMTWSTSPVTTANADLTTQTAAGNITTFTVGASTATFNVSVYINVTAVATDVIQAQITYTDENNVSQTVSLASLSTVTNSTYNPTTIRAKNATVITLKTNLTTGIGSITFDAGGCITKMY